MEKVRHPTVDEWQELRKLRFPSIYKKAVVIEDREDYRAIWANILHTLDVPAEIVKNAEEVTSKNFARWILEDACWFMDEQLWDGCEYGSTYVQGLLGLGIDPKRIAHVSANEVVNDFGTVCANLYKPYMEDVEGQCVISQTYLAKVNSILAGNVICETYSCTKCRIFIPWNGARYYCHG